MGKSATQHTKLPITTFPRPPAHHCYKASKRHPTYGHRNVWGGIHKSSEIPSNPSMGYVGQLILTLWFAYGRRLISKVRLRTGIFRTYTTTIHTHLCIFAPLLINRCCTQALVRQIRKWGRTRYSTCPSSMRICQTRGVRSPFLRSLNTQVEYRAFPHFLIFRNTTHVQHLFIRRGAKIQRCVWIVL